MSAPFRATQQSLFTPTSISGCVIWFDGADTGTLTRSGTTVSAWSSKGSASLTATSVGAGSIVYEQYSGKYSLRFNGTNTKMTTGSVTSYGASATTWIACSVNLNPATADASVVFASSSNPERSIRYTDGTAQIYSLIGSTLRYSSNTDNGIRGFIDTAASFTAYANGTDVTTSTQAVTYVGGTNQSFQLGQWNIAYLNGYIMEVVVYNSALTLTQYQQVEGYLAWKWGFQGSLSASHPYKNTPVYAAPPFPLVPYVPYVTNSAVFLPTQISGCQLWFDAADLTTFTLSSSNITQWNDKSSNKYAVYQGTAASQPTISYGAQNGLNGIQFATSTYLSNLATNMTNFTSGTATSVFIAARNASTNTGWNIINTIWFIASGDGGTQRYHFSFNQNTTDGTTLYTNGVLVGQVTSNATPASSNAILGFTASATSQTIHTNGSTDTYGGVSLPNASGSTLFVFNDNRNNSAASSNTMIFEMLGYNKQVSSSERQQIEGYLAWKWGLTSLLPTTNPYGTTPIAPFPFPSAPRLAVGKYWSPLNITGCATWLDAMDTNTLTFVGSKISKWDDKTTNNRYASAATATNYANYQNQSVFFPAYSAGVQDALFVFNNFITSITGYSMFVVTKPSTNTTIFKTLIKGDAAGPHVILTNVGTTNVGTFDGTFKQFGSITMDGTARVMLYLQIDGSSVFSASLNGTITLTSGVSATNTSIQYFGNASQGQQPWGEVNEFVVYSSNLGTTNRQTVEGYLAWKWGIQGSLPAAHPYKNFPPPP